MFSATSSKFLSMYSILDVATRQIRLLILQPSLRSNSTIKCELLVTRLDEPENLSGLDFINKPSSISGSAVGRPSYEALSYVWGDPSAPVTIKLNGHEITITQNLHSALLALRSRTKKRILWVDALCINQGDLAERASQVQVMRFIYESAHQVIIYLGAGTAESARAFKFVKEFHKQAEQVTDASDAAKLKQWILEIALVDQPWAVLCLDVLERPWWTRAWTFQEVLCASKATVQCGDQLLSWDALGTLATIVDEMETALQSQGGLGVRLFISMYQHLYNMTTYRKQRPFSPPTFSELLRVRRKTKAADPRDKIFAILGVCKDDITAVPAHPPSSKELRIDYKRSVADVYKGAAKHLMLKNHNLDVLSACQNPHRLDELPSWAPDWRVPRYNNPIMDVDTWGHIHFVCGEIASIRVFSTAVDAKSNAVHSSSVAASSGDEYGDDAIVVHGTAVTQISSIGPLYLGSEEELQEIFTSWQRLGLNTSCAHPDGTPCQPGDEILPDGSLLYLTGETVREAFSMTTTVGRVPPPDPKRLGLGSDSDSDSDAKGPEDTNASGCSDTEHIDACAILQYEAEYKASKERAFKDATENRRFFVTQDNVFMGLGPSEAKVDDVVAILYGGHVATILRKLEGDNSEKMEEFVVVGEAYVHGLMNGETFMDAYRKELDETLKKSVVTRDFVLR